MWTKIAAVAAGTAGATAGITLLRRRSAAGHRSESPDEYRHARHRILILGGGFGGMSAALQLDRLVGAHPDTSILVVDRNNAMLFTPLLWTVADGRTSPGDIVVPLRAFQGGRRFHVLHAEVTGVDLDRREVHTTVGARPYDVLVVALGSITAVPDLPGLREHSRVFHSPADAVELRNHIIEAVESAHAADDPEERQEWLTFAVAGGGDTGIELAATILTYLRRALFSEYPWLSDEAVRVVVVGRADRLVPMSRPSTSEAVERILTAEGVEVLTGVSVEAVTERCVRTSAGDIPARTVFWAAGTTAPATVRGLPVEHARNGAVVVDRYLRVPGRPEVYVVGDAAWAFDGETGEPLPPTAQAAEHEGRYVANAIRLAMEGQDVPPFRFSPLGHMALLGEATGVTEVGRVTLTGLPAWLMWHAYYLSHIPSWRNRVRLAGSWLLSALTGRETAQLRLKSPQAAAPARTGSGSV